MSDEATAAEVDQMVLAQVPRLQSTDASVRREAAKAIYEICFQHKELATQAVRPLLGCMGDEDEKVRESAQWGLSYCGKRARSQLRKCLSSPNRLVRVNAAKSLGNGHKAGIRERLALRRLLADEDSDVRSSAAWALSAVGARDSGTISRLRTLINSPLASDRSAALHALGNLGRGIEKKTKIRDWFDQIVPALTDSDEQVRWSAYYVLSAVKVPRESSLPLWTRGLSDPDEQVVSMALKGFADVAIEQDIVAATELLSEVVERQIGASGDACKTLARVGAKAGPAVPSLTKVLESNSPHLVGAAAAALWEIDQRVDESLPALAELMKTPGIGTGEIVCDAVYHIGRAAAPLTSLVLDMLAVEDYDLQWAAADALGAIASTEPPVIDSLINALDHPSGVVCNAAMQALLSLGPDAVPALVDALDHADGHRREYVADVLARFGPKARVASNKLLQLINDAEPNARAWCAIALGKVAASSTAVPVLIDTLENIEGVNIRRQAIESLAEIGPAARDGIPTIERFLDDSDEDLRDVAEDALERIAGGASQDR
jgi:HEAT repeat protein